MSNLPTRDEFVKEINTSLQEIANVLKVGKDQRMSRA